jgi:tRNA G18 (ribose-2'-O)-methylase SpoU
MLTLADAGFTTAALALSDDSVSLGSSRLRGVDRLALLLGTEGDGLSHEAVSAADAVVRIPMSHGVDSLNVAAASAVAFWELCDHPTAD